MKDEFWIKRDGTRIAVGDMDVDHLRNTLRLIIRKNRQRKILDFLDCESTEKFSATEQLKRQRR